MKLKLTLEYDGAGFKGWARQPGERTVEGVLREALAATFATSTARRRRAHRCGVHARANVASVDAEAGRHHPGRRPTRRCPTMSRSSWPRRPKASSTRASPPSRAVSLPRSGAGRRPRSRRDARSGGPARSTRRRRCIRRPARRKTTSALTRRDTPQGPSGASLGGAGRHHPISRSPPTASSGTWCARRHDAGGRDPALPRGAARRGRPDCAAGASTRAACRGSK